MFMLNKLFESESESEYLKLAIQFKSRVKIELYLQYFEA